MALELPTHRRQRRRWKLTPLDCVFKFAAKGVNIMPVELGLQVPHHFV